MPYDDMNETQFEEFCFELMRDMGFVNLDWRKGTGLAASPSDSGRDIVAQLPREELDGRHYLETWFVDCKHYQRGIPPDKITSLLAWATAERADVALVIASNYLSNPCKDFLKSYETNNRPPFRVRYWERPNLERLLESRDEFIIRHLQSKRRTEAEIIEAEQEFFDRVWYNRKMVLEERIAAGDKSIPEELIATMRAACREMEAKYGEGNLGPYSDFEWGMVSGKLSALRWVLGDEWDNLDS
ncbi:restriction endonuclease [Actinacidiphila oryziradicis]|uniref:Restriction endonuclease n=1 Tax=Actinacidiphila oryziradicis TaxID=2571141 RepID=A0A4V6WIV0_9ACTN|nr:restriction endonuclease [Actinacidiphila oryziradicis]TJZ95068.1 restriction endonuclease [Actinacidiphila oryziradicis]